MRLAGVFQLRGLAEGLDRIGAAGTKLTAQTDEALQLNKVLLQGTHGVHVAEIHCIDVPAGGPAVTVGVEENDDFGEIVVMVDQELEVRKSLAAFVLWGVHRDVGIIDGVNNSMPSKLR